ncbi:MAG TPA: NAD(P)/FAD-dependent oxidoreductase [Pseudomonadales bacterium]|nr:NAD(P)/FAD-dependent oxidoreductase [Pseudomonadales bacterium]HNH19635.1 NAD(P)/FAD-dependent oxidoreductase [Pseudomonadales bacterium]HNN36433.1 NAD(P)/FAD-dependent oxidoreductase [Pseudomonadales bacterium]
MGSVQQGVAARGDSPRFIIIGGGMAGILSAIKLREAGFTNFIGYEKADRLGGTWRENRYPGVACDVPSHFYSYSFAPNPEWSHVFSPGEEIWSYFEEVARRYDVVKDFRFGTEVRSMAFRDGRWHLELSTGERDVADFVIAATGVLHHPAYPAIAGLDRFQGAMFHTARWDQSVPLDNRRVGIIGTGSTAVQIVSALVGRVAQLKLFQRTAQWIMPRPNPPIAEADKALFRSDPAVMAAMRAELGKSASENFATAVVNINSPQLREIEQLCLANLEENVTDPVLREKLRPHYRAACKRLIMSPDFYQAIQRPNAQLVTESIEAVEAGGVRTVDGVLHELDVLVLATGFQVDRFMRPIEVVGRNGMTLDEVWAKRPSAYLAISIPDFPNLFMLNGPNGPVGNFSLIDVAEIQFDYIMQLIEEARRRQAHQVSVKPQAAERFENERVEATRNTVWVSGCRSWYLDDRGIPAAWPWGFDRFREVMAQPKFEDFELVA